MPATLTVRDETPAGGVSNEWSLEFLSETITVRDLIRERRLPGSPGPQPPPAIRPAPTGDWSGPRDMNGR